MKKYIFILTCLLTVVILSSCLKPKHQIRIKNNYSRALRIKIGVTDYGTVVGGTTTAYKAITEGNHQLSGDVTGSANVKGRGRHNWTFTISADGQFSFKEDK